MGVVEVVVFVVVVLFCNRGNLGFPFLFLSPIFPNGSEVLVGGRSASAAALFAVEVSAWSTPHSFL